MSAEGIRDLAWWQIPHWVPAWPRVLATVVACELVVGLVTGLGVRFAVTLVSKLGLASTPDIGNWFTMTFVSKLGLALTIGLVIGFMGAFGDRPFRHLSWLQPSKTNIRAGLMAGLLCGFTFGLVGGLVNGLINGLSNGLVYGLMAGLVSGCIVGLVGTFGERPPQYLSRPRWRKAGVLSNLLVGLMFALMLGLMYGLRTRDAGAALHRAVPSGHGYGLGNGLVVSAAILLMVGFAIVLGRPSTETTSPVDPRSSWRQNRQFGLVIGLVTALTYGLVQSLVVVLASWIVIWIMCGLALGIAVGLTFPATWQVTLASTQLWRRGEAPVRLLRFLEDARDR
jgi:hypothetical protein